MLIKIKNLKLKTIIGVHAWEKNIPREILINLEITPNNNKSLESDNIEDAIDYDALAHEIKNFLEKKHFKLVEKMANEIMKKIMEDSRIKKCKLEIDKVGALSFIESFSVTLEQERKNGH
jgi:dihydroneopterin aldolase